jgi:hypothetical protein
MRDAATRAFQPARRSAVVAGITAVVLAGSGSAYACTGADVSSTHLTAFTPAQVAAIRAELKTDVAALRQAKALELAAIKAHDRVAALAGARQAALAKTKLRADVEAAIAKARAEAKARAAARARAADKVRAEEMARDSRAAANFHYNHPWRHHCDGGWSGYHH